MLASPPSSACCLCPVQVWASVPEGFLEPLKAVNGEWAVLAGLQEALYVGQEDVAGREEACAQPEQLPAPVLAIPAGGGEVSGKSATRV